MKMEMINVNFSWFGQKLKFICFDAEKSFMIKTCIRTLLYFAISKRLDGQSDDLFQNLYGITDDASEI